MFARRQTRGGGYNNYRGSTRGGTRKAPPAKTARGLFADGVWQCDCTPRLPAERFQVKKESPNKGRWFYTCQQEKSRSCGFFIWGDEAQNRERAAVLSNSRTEPRESLTVTPSTTNKTSMHLGGLDGTDDSTESEPEPSPSRQPRPTNKRTARVAFDSDEEFDNDFTLSAEETQALLDNTGPETPHKTMQNGAYATPATTAKKRKLPWQMDTAPVPAPPALAKSRTDELLTPVKTPLSKDVVSIEVVSTPAKTTALEEAVTPSKAPVITTPDRPIQAESEHHSPKRYFDALADPDDSNSALAMEVLAELSGVRIPPQTLAKVRSILSKHELKTQGITKGRDMTRMALKTEQERTGMLQRRIQTLQNELQHQKAMKTVNQATSLRR